MNLFSDLALHNMGPGLGANMIEAILAHRSAGNGSYGPSEANAVIASYSALSMAEQQDLVNFLRAL